MSQCLIPCQQCNILVSVLILANKECAGMSSIVTQIMDECDFDDVSVVFRVGSIDQSIKCSAINRMTNNYDDYLF